MKHTLILLLTAMLFSSCNTQNTTEKISENNLSAKIEYGDKMATKTVFESDYKMILFALKKGQDLQPHSAPMDAPLVMLEGSAKVTIGNEETTKQISCRSDRMQGRNDSTAAASSPLSPASIVTRF